MQNYRNKLFSISKTMQTSCTANPNNPQRHQITARGQKQSALMQRDLKNAKLPTRGYTKLQPQLLSQHIRHHIQNHQTEPDTEVKGHQHPTSRLQWSCRNFVSPSVQRDEAPKATPAPVSGLHLCFGLPTWPGGGGRRASLIQKEISHTSEIMSQSSHVSSAGLEMELVYSRLSLMTHEHVEQTRGSHQLGF